MYDITLPVEACLRAGTRVDVAWAVEASGFSARDRTEALALTPGGGRIGGVLSGSANDQLADAAARGGGGRLLALHITELEARAFGLDCAGDARCLLVPAADLPERLWRLLTDREPVCLVSRLDGDAVVSTELYTAADVAQAGDLAAQLLARGSTDAVVSDDVVVSVFWPVPKLVVVGGGGIAEALGNAAALLGWRTVVSTDVSTATGLVAGLAVLDKVVVMSHDVDVAGPVLEAALSSDAGYIAALGSRGTQQTRADWLAMRGVTDLDRVHGPAGLDIGASTPAEIAVSIVAEALAVRTGSTGGSLSDRSRQAIP